MKEGVGIPGGKNEEQRSGKSMGKSRQTFIPENIKAMTHEVKI